MDSSVDDPDQIEGDVIEIIPLNEYESQKAKLRASLSWILHKAYPDAVPSEFREPFYETPEGTLHVKPRLANLMVTSELYGLACTSMFGDSHCQWKGHWRIIQALSRKGIYVTEPDNNAVTETVLMKTAPFQLNAHLALIDALMMAYCSEVTSIEHVVQAVRRFAAFNASSELPTTIDDTLMFWINKVCGAVQHRIIKSSHLIEGETQQKVRIVSRNTPRDQLTVPILDDIIKDIGDGCSLAVLVHFYCPHLLKLEDICLKSNIGIADSLHNLRLVRSFCLKHIPNLCFHLTYEDFLYTHSDLKQNIYVMISELFYWFEMKKLECMKEPKTTDTVELPTASRPASHTVIPQVPISNATKRSFHKQIMDDQRISQTSTYVPPRQPLLHKRQQQSVDSPESGTAKSRKNGRRSQSLSSPQERDVIKQSVTAWQDSSKTQLARSNEQLKPVEQSRETTSSNLLANVSIDSQLDDSFSDDRLEGLDISLQSGSTPSPTPPHKGDVSSNARMVPPGHPDYLELESVNSGVNTSRTYTCYEKPTMMAGEINPEEFLNSANQPKPMGLNAEDFLPKMEPLLPARLKTAKEKINNHSKEEERGDMSERRKLKSPPKTKNSLASSQVTDISDESGSVISDIVTPLPEDQLSARDAYTSSPRQHSKGYAAFVMVGDPMQDVVSLKSHSGSEKSLELDKEIKASYTVTDHAYTSESARAAGIPVVESTENLPHQRRESREGSVASSRSSGDFSDHESHKIHKDHKTRESENIKTLLTQTKDLFPVQKPVVKIVTKTESDFNKSRPLTTNFAEIKRMKANIDKVDNSGYVYMQHGQEASSSNNEQRKSAIRDKSEKNKTEKKTSFAATPNQTTWLQTTTPKQTEPERMANGDGSGTGAELSQIRMKLEEKRKLIERKKQTMELQQQKMRQRLGKTAFLHVVSKPKEEEPDASVAENTGRIQADVGASDANCLIDTGRPNSLQPDVSMSSFTSPSQKRFSREGIQQTIENVRKKWFQDDSITSNGTEQRSEIHKVTEQHSGHCDRPLHEQSYRHDQENISEPLSQAELRNEPKFVSQPVRSDIPLEKPQIQSSQERVQNISSNRGESPPQRKESDSEYNTSLDKLNQSLTDLQGEIMKLSLQQEHLKMIETPKKDSVAGHNIGINTSSNNGRVLSDMPVPTPERVVLGMGAGDQQYHVATTMHPQPYVQQPVVIRGQQGPILTGQNQYIPVSPATVQYPAAYSTGQTVPPPHPAYAQQPPYPQTLPHHGYTQSPPYPHVIPPQLSPMTSSPFSVTMPYQPYSPVSNTYTVPSSHVHHPAVSMMTTGHSGAQMYNPTSVYQPSSIPQTVSQIPPRSEQDSINTTPQQTVTSESERTSDVMNNDDQSVSQNGFFVSFGDGTPKKPKPSHLHSDSPKNSPIHLRSQQRSDSGSSSGHEVEKRQDESLTDVSQNTTAPSMVEQTTEMNDISGEEDQSQLSQNTSGIKFVIVEEQSAEDEMEKKKEKLAQLQMKRREDQERKRQYKEIEMARRKEREMAKQEEAEKKKSEDKARREMIFKQYQEKKNAADDNNIPRRREKPSQQKPRPKSMFVKAKDGTMSNDGSMENLSGQAFTSDMEQDTRRIPVRVPHKKRVSRSCSASKAGGSRLSSSRLAPPRGKMRKAVSCNTLHDDGKLMHGGMTHRRPPSPDLYRLRKGRSGTDSSSETGSNNAGSDYAGPKLFVKPSSKSNRHIIINAISHCCLAGSVNTDVKNKVLEEIARSDGKHFVILFRDSGCQYRSLYQYNPETDDVIKIIGVGPKNITNKMIEKFYKYNSGAKSFSEVTSTKHLSVSIDAVVLLNSVWKSGKPPSAKLI